MNTTQEKKEYTIDDEPVTWRELLDRADAIGYFSDPSFKRTSEAAAILRNAGYKVGYNTSS